MPRVSVHERAREDVDEIAAYIARDNLDAALRFYDAAESAFELLARMPGAGPVVDPPIANAPDLRFWPIARYRNYLVLYVPLSDGIDVLRVLHGARDIAAALSRG